MTTALKILRRLRNDLQDIVEPYLWQDEELLDYLSEAQEQFCKQGMPIIDSKSSICSIEIEAGDEDVKYHESIQRIIEAKAKEFVNGVPKYHKIKVTTQSNFLDLESTNTHDYGNTVHNETWIHQRGELYAIAVDYDQEYLRLIPIPNKDYTLLLTVERLPLNEINDVNDELEVRSIYHSAIRNWAAYLAFMRQDSETFDENAANRFADLFALDIELAKRDRSKRNRRAGTVVYGGI